MTTAAVDAAAVAIAGHAAKGMAAASSDGGGLRAALSRNRRLGIEAAVVAGVLVVAGFLVFHFFVKTIKNTRPLGGVNVVVTHGHDGTENEAAFAIDEARPSVVFGASNELRTYTSLDGGRTWRGRDGPSMGATACARGEPRAASAAGREVLAFLAGSPCGDDVTPYLVVTSRAGPHGRWLPPKRVVAPAWKYGFDDAPALTADTHGRSLYLSWTRSLGTTAAATVVSRSDDGGRTWSAPVVAAPPKDEPHLSTIAVAPNGDVYVAGIDAPHGIWIAKSSDRGRTFGAPRAAGPLRGNPSSTCALAGLQPLPKEPRSCSGPNPTVLASARGAAVVYDDFGAGRTQDVFIAAVDSNLRPRFVVPVTPPDRGHTQQFFPAAGLDRTTGTFWACWYDTTFDPHGHRAWFTCSASHDGRTWSGPERAAAEPSMVNDLYADLGSGNGFSPSVVAAAGTAHPFWIAISSSDFRQQIGTARLPERAAFAVTP